MQLLALLYSEFNIMIDVGLAFSIFKLHFPLIGQWGLLSFVVNWNLH